MNNKNGEPRVFYSYIAFFFFYSKNDWPCYIEKQFRSVLWEVQANHGLFLSHKELVHHHSRLGTEEINRVKEKMNKDQGTFFKKYYFQSQLRILVMLSIEKQKKYLFIEEEDKIQKYLFLHILSIDRWNNVLPLYINFSIWNS